MKAVGYRVPEYTNPTTASDWLIDLEIPPTPASGRLTELNRRPDFEQSDALPATFIANTLVRKVKDGRATHLYAR